MNDKFIYLFVLILFGVTLHLNLKQIKQNKQEFSFQHDQCDNKLNELQERRLAKIDHIRDTVKAVIEKNNYSYISIDRLNKYATAVVDWSDVYDVPVPLILAVTQQESRFNPRAISPAGAKGIIQVMPNTAKHISEEIDIINYDMHDIYDNI